MPEHSHSLRITTQQADGGQIAQRLPPRSEPQSAVSSSLLIFRKRRYENMDAYELLYLASGLSREYIQAGPCSKACHAALPVLLLEQVQTEVTIPLVVTKPCLAPQTEEDEPLAELPNGVTIQAHHVRCNRCNKFVRVRGNPFNRKNMHHYCRIQEILEEEGITRIEGVDHV